VQWGKGHKW